eukprot:TRINITY_DN26834_c0_g1_i1.p1 TRINITY_DN26834_c0_g1~~TRINITY_DN26834_c0_g1_i1.p1  ORF type:complete len:231 (+),score=87.48 TRINITY_DN26834_c0_g1_i1:53-745(+)
MMLGITKRMGTAPLFARCIQRRFFETEAMDILSIKKGDYVHYEGYFAKVLDRNSKSSGRGSANGEMRIRPLTGAKKGAEFVIQGLKFNKVEMDKVKVQFTGVDEEKEMLVFELMGKNVGSDTTLLGQGKFYELTGEDFGDLIADGDANTLKWLTPDMVLNALMVDDDILELKMPPTHTYTIENVSQVGGRYMALIEENEEQVHITATNARPGDGIVISLPRGRFAKLTKN